MQIYLLKPINEIKEPWKPWYDKAFGFVVRAACEEDARRFASYQCGDEGADAWLNPSLSICDVLSNDGEDGVILRNFASA